MGNILLKISKPAPEIKEIFEYLKANKWKIIKNFKHEHGRVITYFGREKNENVLIVPTENFIDYTPAISQVINNIAEIENKTSYEIYEEILSFKKE